MFEKERESSDVLPGSQQPAREAPGRRGGEASKHSAEVGKPHKRETLTGGLTVFSRKVGAAVRLSQEQPSDEDL